MSDGGGTPGPKISQLCAARQVWEGAVSGAALTSRPITLSSLSSRNAIALFEDYISKTFFTKEPKLG